MPDPAHELGDIKAQVAALNTAEQRVHDPVDRYGHDQVVNGIDEVLDYAERTPAGLRPDPGRHLHVQGLYRRRRGGGRPIRIKLAMPVQAAEIDLDFSETDLQIQS